MKFKHIIIIVIAALVFGLLAFLSIEVQSKKQLVTKNITVDQLTTTETDTAAENNKNEQK